MSVQSLMQQLCLLILLIFCSVSKSHSESTINVTNGEWQPYLSNFSHEYGLASHIVSEAFKLEGVDVTWGFFPWARAYKLAEKGEEWQASAVWWPTEDTKKNFWVSDVVVNTSFVFFHLKEFNFKWDSIQDLSPYQIGFTRGYDYGDKFMSAVKEGQLSVQVVQSDEQSFKKLLLGRIDIFPNDPLVGYAQIKHIFTAQEAKLITHNERSFEASTLHLILSKKAKNNKRYLKKFNAGLKKLKKSGRIAQMYKNLDKGKYDKKQFIWVKH